MQGRDRAGHSCLLTACVGSGKFRKCPGVHGHLRTIRSFMCSIAATAGWASLVNTDPEGLQDWYNGQDPLYRTPQEIRQFSQAEIDCLSSVLGISVASIGAAMWALGQSVFSKRFWVKGTSSGPSIASLLLSDWFPQKLASSVWTPTSVNLAARSPVVGRIIGRWIPWIGVALNALDVAAWLSCVHDECKYGKQGPSPAPPPPTPKKRIHYLGEEFLLGWGTPLGDE